MGSTRAFSAILCFFAMPNWFLISKSLNLCSIYMCVYILKIIFATSTNFHPKYPKLCTYLAHTFLKYAITLGPLYRHAYDSTIYSLGQRFAIEIEPKSKFCSFVICSFPAAVGRSVGQSACNFYSLIFMHTKLCMCALIFASPFTIATIRQTQRQPSVLSFCPTFYIYTWYVHAYEVFEKQYCVKRAAEFRVFVRAIMKGRQCIRSLYALHMNFQLSPLVYLSRFLSLHIF